MLTCDFCRETKHIGVYASKAAVLEAASDYMLVVASTAWSDMHDDDGDGGEGGMVWFGAGDTLVAREHAVQSVADVEAQRPECVPIGPVVIGPWVAAYGRWPRRTYHGGSLAACVHPVRNGSPQGPARWAVVGPPGVFIGHHRGVEDDAELAMKAADKRLGHLVAECGGVL